MAVSGLLGHRHIANTESISASFAPTGPGATALVLALDLMSSTTQPSALPRLRSERLRHLRLFHHIRGDRVSSGSAPFKRCATKFRNLYLFDLIT